MTVITNEQNPNPVYIANCYLTIHVGGHKKILFVLVNYNITSVVDTSYLSWFSPSGILIYVHVSVYTDNHW